MKEIKKRIRKKMKYLLTNDKAIKGKRKILMFRDALKTKNRRDEKAGFLSSIPIKKRKGKNNERKRSEKK